ncbi:unnamed protein product [Withania somnifera]
MDKQHILVIPYPEQGHVIPLMELAQSLAKYGFKITFVISESTHKRILNSLSEKNILHDQINLISVLDESESGEDKTMPGKIFEAIFKFMPGKIEKLIQEKNASEDEKITCVIADQSFGWALELATKLGIKKAAFITAAAANLVLGFNIPRLINDGIIDSDARAFKLAQMIVPIGPLLSRNSLESSTFPLETYSDVSSKESSTSPARSLRSEDSTCLNWLDQQPLCSVVYISFGSFTVFNESQFQELALGIELSNKPFLWVVRTNATYAKIDIFLKHFMNRIGRQKGKIVSWAPQRSHCGWNSTIEAISNGVPILCWPYFADRFMNRKGDNGIITCGEIMDKVKQLLKNDAYKKRALQLKKITTSSVKEGGRSHQNLINFIEWIKS